jgi:hypothetical protein
MGFLSVLMFRADAGIAYTLSLSLIGDGWRGELGATRVLETGETAVKQESVC